MYWGSALKVLFGSLLVAGMLIASLVGGVFFGAAYGNPFGWGKIQIAHK